MKTRLLTLLGAVLFFSMSLQAQDTVNITQEIQRWSSAIMEHQSPLTFSLNEEQYELYKENIVWEGKGFILNAALKNKKGSFLLRNIEGIFYGYLYLPEEKNSYVFKELSGKKVAIVVKASDILTDDASIKNTESSEMGPAPVPGNTSVFPLGNALTAAYLELESKPGSKNVLYLDFDGENIDGWGYDSVKVMFNSGMDAATIRKTWEIIAGDFMQFDANVTTNRAVFDAALVSKRMMCVYGYSAIGQIKQVLGLGFVNIFGNNKGVLVNVGGVGLKTNDYEGAGNVGAHEIGHGMGLAHDGKTYSNHTDAYYGGHSDWAPIMGAGGGFYATWSKGEYSGATNTQDDVAIIGAQTGYRNDDYVSATSLLAGKGDSVNWEDNHGIIENSYDVDTFSFELSAPGIIKITAGTACDYTDLDIDLSLLNASLQTLAHDNKHLIRSAEIIQNVAAGKYYLLVKSGYELTPDTGFSSYSSFGYYELYGRVENLKKADYEIACTSLKGFKTVCGENSEGEGVFKNLGSKSITGGKVNVYVDDVLSNTINVTATIQPGDSLVLSNILATQVGWHILKVEYVSPSGIKESTNKNNALSINYYFQKGIEHTFTTNSSAYELSKSFGWEIKDQSTGSVVFTSANVPSETNAGVLTQKFCLLPGCYNYNMTGKFKQCDVVYSGYTNYVSGKAYNGGDLVLYEGVMYQAQFYVTKAPGPNFPGTGWKYAGYCDVATSYAKIYNEEEKKMMVNFSSDTYDPANASKSFCVNMADAQYDITLSDINFPSRCGDISQGSCILKNLGKNAISGGKVNLYVDAIFYSAVNISGTIAAGDSLSVSGFPVSIPVTKEIKMEYVSDPSVTEELLTNNSLIKAYVFEKGTHYSVNVNVPYYNLNTPLNWQIKDSATAAVIVNGSTSAYTKNGNTVTQDFCLQPRCYSFEVKGDFALCSYQYPNYKLYQNGGTYVGGDIVYHQGKLYKASYWTQTAPPGSAWSLLQTCNDGAYSVKLTEVAAGKNKALITSAQYVPSFSKTNFCDDNVTTAVESYAISSANVYPNPAEDILYISSPKMIETIRVYDITGKLVVSQSSLSTLIQLDISVWTSGVYMITVAYSDHEEYTRVVK